MRRYVDPVPALKAQLAREILTLMDSPAALAGALLRTIGGPRLSNIRLDRLDRFSVQGLIRILTRLGCDVELSIVSPEQVRMREHAARMKEQRS